jgi:hypothetical protein
MQIKNIHIKVFALLIAFYFLLAGTGITIVDYCCDSCESAGIEFISANSCHAIHHSFAAQDDSCCLIDSSEQTSTAHCTMEKMCDVQRLELDDYSPSPNRQLTCSSEHVVMIPSIVSGIINPQTPGTYTHPYFYPPPEPGARFGRTILTNKSVLII